MKILIINNETLHLKELIELFKDNDVDVCNIWDNFDINTYDLYVLSWWSHHSIFFEPNPYQKEINFIKTTKKKVIWICLWCQIIAKAYNSILDELPQKIKWIINIEYNNKIYKVFEAHRYAIKNLSKDLLSLCESKYGYEIIKHKNKSIRWFQFHPEVHMKSNQWKKILQQIIEF